MISETEAEDLEAFCEAASSYFVCLTLDSFPHLVASCELL
jgi:hypothetical protein